MIHASVIIPAHKAEDHLAFAVSSVLAQTYKDVEVLVASDANEDYQPILQAQDIHGTRIRYVSTGKTGTWASHKRNAALQVAKGRIIATLDADDRLRPDALETIVPMALQHGGAYSDVSFIDYATDEILPNRNCLLPEGKVTLYQALTTNIHTFAWIAFDRKKIPQAQWLERVHYFNDLTFFAYCCDVLGSLYYIPQRLYQYYKREGSLCNRPEAAQDFLGDIQRISQEMDNDPRLFAQSPDSRELLRKHLLKWQRIETLFEEALAAGKYADYQEFMGDNLELFYRL